MPRAQVSQFPQFSQFFRPRSSDFLGAVPPIPRPAVIDMEMMRTPKDRMLPKEKQANLRK